MVLIGVLRIIVGFLRKNELLSHKGIVPKRAIEMGFFAKSFVLIDVVLCGFYLYKL